MGVPMGAPRLDDDDDDGSTVMWSKLDDKMHSQSAFLEVGDAGCGVWAKGESWIGDNLTDGFIPEKALRILAEDPELAAILVRVGLWRRVEGGFESVGYLDRNPDKAKVEAERERTRQKVEAFRRRRRGQAATAAEVVEGTLGNLAGNPVTNPVRNRVDNRAPVPEGYIGTDVPMSSGTADDRAAAIEQVWQAYLWALGEFGKRPDQYKLTQPRKKAISTRLNQGYSVEDLVDAVRGWLYSHHHVGHNDRHTAYHDLGLLLSIGSINGRERNNVEKFRDLWRENQGRPFAFEEPDPGDVRSMPRQSRAEELAARADEKRRVAAGAMVPVGGRMPS